MHVMCQGSGERVRVCQAHGGTEVGTYIKTLINLNSGIKFLNVKTQQKQGEGERIKGEERAREKCEK